MIIFGPIPSRRLGWSLGIDLVSYKTCTLDCLYCECGKTTDLTLQKTSTYTVQEVLSQLESQMLQAQHKIDYITFSGSGANCGECNGGGIVPFSRHVAIT